ncbi:MAG: lamin tail domain-containing protein, partial [Candidatus Bipolaricaulota bacterium]|nr:lamin tail domain-containing protein [Candidatus Bipolaricaulota bacterium]
NGAYDEGLGAWTLGSLIAGRSASLTITARTAPGTADSTLANIAEVTRSSLPDPDLTNNRDQADVHVAAGGGGGGGAADDCSGRVIINEIAWAGTAADPEGQWIELRNVGTAPVDLTGWTLRWRKKVPVTAEDYVWREVQLSGVLQGAATSACALALQIQQTADIEFTKRDAVSWLVVAEPRQDDGSYLLLERKSDETIRNIDADIVYDVAQPYSLALAPEGDVMQLLDPVGSVIDTANAFEPIQNGWPAGDATTFASMERTDPL